MILRLSDDILAGKRCYLRNRKQRYNKVHLLNGVMQLYFISHCSEEFNITFHKNGNQIPHIIINIWSTFSFSARTTPQPFSHSPLVMVELRNHKLSSSKEMPSMDFLPPRKQGYDIKGNIKSRQTESAKYRIFAIGRS